MCHYEKSIEHKKGSREEMRNKNIYETYRQSLKK